VSMCETCGKQSELFHLPGRKDNNCTACNAAISMLIVLYRRWELSEKNGEELADLEAQLVAMLYGLLERAASRSCCNIASHEDIRSEGFIN
jgi:hypothetical protein